MPAPRRKPTGSQQRFSVLSTKARNPRPIFAGKDRRKLYWEKSLSPKGRKTGVGDTAFAQYIGETPRNSKILNDIRYRSTYLDLDAKLLSVDPNLHSKYKRFLKNVGDLLSSEGVRETDVLRFYQLDNKFYVSVSSYILSTAPRTYFLLKDERVINDLKIYNKKDPRGHRRR